MQFLVQAATHIYLLTFLVSISTPINYNSLRSSTSLSPISFILHSIIAATIDTLQRVSMWTCFTLQPHKRTCSLFQPSWKLIISSFYLERKWPPLHFVFWRVMTSRRRYRHAALLKWLTSTCWRHHFFLFKESPLAMSKRKLKQSMFSAVSL